jgi:oligopeptide transport system ATP-binding protein
MTDIKKTNEPLSKKQIKKQDKTKFKEEYLKARDEYRVLVAAHNKKISVLENQAKVLRRKKKDITREDEAKMASLEEQVKQEDFSFAKTSDPVKEKMEDYYDRYKYYDVTFRQDLVDRKVILSLSHVKEFFDMGQDMKTKAVHDVSFDVYENECFGLVGESGCGKTTTGRSIIGLYKLTSGSIYYKGFRISGGTRWNEKEIKWSRIHTKEKIRKIQQETNEKVFKLQDEIHGKIKTLKQEEKNELEEKDSPENDNNDLVLEGIKEDYDKKIKAAQDDKKIKILRQYEHDAIKALNEEEKAHVDEQKKIIKQIKYDNNHVNPKLMHEIQMIFQDPVDSLDPRMTVEDIIEEGLHIQHQYNKLENQQKCAEMLERVGLIADYASRYPHEFSGGQRQRIGIARALIMNPKFLICDEPISALDVSIRAQIINLLNDLKDQMGITMMFIAHDLSVVKYFCDRIAVMYFGNLVEVATSEELFKHPLHPYTRSLLSAIPKPDPLGEKKRIRITYNPKTAHDYSKEKPVLQEILPGHWVLANSEEIKKYKAEMVEMDKKNAVSDDSKK